MQLLTSLFYILGRLKTKSGRQLPDPLQNFTDDLEMAKKRQRQKGTGAQKVPPDVARPL